MKFAATESLIATCEKSLASLSAPNPEFEAVVTAMVVVRIVAGFEAFLHDAVARFAKTMRDPRATSYINATRQRWFKKYSLGELKEFLEQFDPAEATRFQAKLLKGQGHSSYDQLVEKRHSFAHGRSLAVDLTLKDTARLFKQAQVVPMEFERALGV